LDDELRYRHIETTLQIPDELARQVASEGKDLARDTLPAHEIHLYYDLSDLDRDRITSERFAGKSSRFRATSRTALGMTIVADSSPINYLVLIQEVEILPSVYARVVIPQAMNARGDEKRSDTASE
jgi:hypothetical protein